MLQGLVAGELWSSVQVPALASHKLLLVHPECPTNELRELVAIDLVGAGVGDRVLVVLGRAARNALGDADAPIEAAIVAVVDGLERSSSLGAELQTQAEKVARNREPDVKQPVRKKKAKRSSSGTGDQTLDLFAEIEPDRNVSSRDLERDDIPEEEPNQIPSIDDVDSIWGEADEDKKGDS